MLVNGDATWEPKLTAHARMGLQGAAANPPACKMAARRVSSRGRGAPAPAVAGQAGAVLTYAVHSAH